jgi:NADH-quinone oxidoreductase subunit G
LVSADRNPNVRGALVTGLIDTLPRARLEALAAAIDAGEVKTVLTLGEDLAAAGLSEAQLAQVAVIYLGATGNGTSAAARVVLPGRTVFEKAGSFINQQFRLQKFLAAIPGAAGSADDLALLHELIGAVGGESPGGTVAAVWSQLANEVSGLSGQTFARFPAHGLLLDGSAWAALPFVEGEGLHFKPAGEERAEGLKS